MLTLLPQYFNFIHLWRRLLLLFCREEFRQDERECLRGQVSELLGNISGTKVTGREVFLAAGCAKIIDSIRGVSEW